MWIKRQSLKTRSNIKRRNHISGKKSISVWFQLIVLISAKCIILGTETEVSPTQSVNLKTIISVNMLHCIFNERHMAYSFHIRIDNM